MANINPPIKEETDDIKFDIFSPEPNSIFYNYSII